MHKLTHIEPGCNGDAVVSNCHQGETQLCMQQSTCGMTSAFNFFTLWSTIGALVLNQHPLVLNVNSTGSLWFRFRMTLDHVDFFLHSGERFHKRCLFLILIVVEPNWATTTKQLSCWVYGGWYREEACFPWQRWMHINTDSSSSHSPRYRFASHVHAARVLHVPAVLIHEASRHDGSQPVHFSVEGGFLYLHWKVSDVWCLGGIITLPTV